MLTNITNINPFSNNEAKPLLIYIVMIIKYIFNHNNDKLVIFTINFNTFFFSMPSFYISLCRMPRQKSFFLIFSMSWATTFIHIEIS